MKELQDKVEQLTLSKASAESKASRSKSMAENLQMLLNLQGGAKATKHPHTALDGYELKEPISGGEDN